ncbi:BLUF domain-containing protein [Cupriavidus gilardii]|uniref:BLUF domain-containing protein n=1 Tax=Cupriavidus gilardii TaxID=82541 RepID=A0A6N1BE46_9BURK|nr:BLUF domain-containing protein [Cupriavidus gilardii]KAB0596910.1 BLUF domain-containing protein [Cupriavidus gilardii]MCT9014884.1 BLUF domain-containing protein [Cupriavidus gilardii]MCT9053296.1 BLUF domain-containing protein [Cupriavidus gilardii]MCT9069902.1 BLUF domain-containing protein [Cupriavidus gilardii]MCT9126856.1 BLUF domain-containing protein [Cupriavidus gilardii]
MLVRLLYASRARQPADEGLVDTIVATSIERNPPQGITGVLCYGNGVFVQALEGARAEVSALYHRIAKDPRHEDVVLLHYEEIGERQFAGWAMGLVDTCRINTATLLKYFPRAEFDPYRTSGRASLALLGELIAGNAVVARSAERTRY